MMAKRKVEKASVITHADHDVILPPSDLRMAIDRAGSEDDLITRADKALADLSLEFPSWMDMECCRLDEARRKIKESGIDDERSIELYRVAHDIRGEAGTLGFPRAGDVADGLCRLIELMPDVRRIPVSLIDQHVDAVRAIIREAKLDDAEKTAIKLAESLQRVTEEFLAAENRDRPGFLENRPAPPLVPGSDRSD
jgi:hypothetical protein